MVLSFSSSNSPSNSNAPAISALEVTKEYSVFAGPRLLSREIAGALLARPVRRAVRALDRVTFSVERGKTLGIIGLNGAGKSTILRLIAGISEPTSGELDVRGSIASLLDFGAGFDPRLTARENIELSGILLGIPRRKIRADESEILHWAEVERHADSQLYTFSTGMAMRLGFAIAMKTEADILLFDEVLAVGDAGFQAKCFDVLERFKRDGKTIVFVSHDLYEIGNFSDEVLLLDTGRVAALGSPDAVIQRYWSTLADEPSRASLGTGRLRLDFVAGKLFLWWDAKPLTKGFCGYVSMRSFVRWQESDKATWNVLERTADSIVVEGTMWALPLRQRWVIAIGEEGFHWRVTATALADVRLARQQVNLMLSEKYDHYSAPDGSWPAVGPFRRAVTDDWDVVFSPPADQRSIALRSSDATLPTVRLHSASDEPEEELAVVNSDLDFRGRLLQCRRTRERELVAGHEYQLFSGRVAIGA